MPLISDHLRLVSSVDIGVKMKFKKGQFEFLATLLAVFPWSAICKNQFCIS